MSLLDYQCPDIVFSRSEIIFSIRQEKNTIVVIQLENSKLIPILIHAHRSNKSHIMNCSYYTWDCIHPKEPSIYNEFTGICNYNPGHEDMPPIPGQKCHNCGGLRAELISIAETIRIELEIK